jgi:hypothetical protein
MSAPSIFAISHTISLVQFAAGLINKLAMNLFDQFHRQSLPRLAPCGIRERLARQMMHGGTGDVAVGDLPREQSQRVAGREFGLSKNMTAGAGELIDSRGKKMIILVVAHPRQCQIERCHPWPPVE